MFSKISTTSLKAMALVASLFVLSACDSKIGEAPPPPAAQEFSGTQCLSDAKPIVKNFVIGEASDREVAATWDCVSGAIDKFRRYVRGDAGDRYTPQELATFLEKNFLDGAVVTPELQRQFMKLKQVFIGGTDTYISRVEIEKVIRLLGSLKQMTLKLNPYMKVISLNWNVNEYGFQSDVVHFEKANVEIQNAAKTLASLIEANGQSYAFADFVVLMNEMGGLFGEEWDFPEVIRTYLPVISKVKKALAGGDENSIAPNEWRRFTLLGARGYVQFMRYHYFIKSVPETGTGYRLSYLARTVEDILSVFQDLVSEKPEGVVSRREIAELLKTFEVISPQFKVSDALVFEGMKLKQLFFGGSVDSLSTTDFESARLKVSRIKVLIERALPYYSIYGREWDPSIYDREEAISLFLESQHVLETTVREAGSLFEGAYDLNDLKDFVREIETLYPPKEGDEHYSEKVNDYLPLVIDVKNIILGGNDSSLRKANWSVLLSFTSRIYSDYLFYDYFLKDTDFKQGPIIKSWSLMVNQTFNIVRDLLGVKESVQLSKAELNVIMRHLVRLKVLPEAITVNSLDQLIKVVLNNFLQTPEDRLSGKVPNALTMSSIEVIRQEVQYWLDGELLISEITDGWSDTKGLRSNEFLTILNNSYAKTLVTMPLRTAAAEMIRQVSSPVTMTVDQQGRVQISNKQQYLYTRKSMSQLNLNRAASRILIRSFAGDLNRIKSYEGVVLPEVESAFQNLKPIFVEMGLLDKSNTGFATSRFMEANIFVPHADGNSTASFTEIADLVGMIMSGLNINTMLREQLVKDCFDRGVEVTDNSLVNLSCVRSTYKEAMPQAMSATPEYLAFTRKASKDEWAYFMNNVFKAAGYVPNSKNMAKMGDIALTPHVIQYIEMIFTRFDANRDGFISTEEGIKAFPTFKGILKDLAKDQLESGRLKESDLLDVFTFILRYGKPPESLKELARFQFFWKGKPHKWDVWADRVQLSQILGYIADQTSKSVPAYNPVPASPELLQEIAEQL